jgi:hypothetical protein
VQLDYAIDSADINAGEGWAAGFALELPLFSQNAMGIERAQAETKRTEAALDMTAAAAAASIRERQRAAQAALEEWRAFHALRTELVERARGALERAGARGQLEDGERVEVALEKLALEKRELELQRVYVEATLALAEALVSVPR